jgi:hypothetical protein
LSVSVLPALFTPLLSLAPAFARNAVVILGWMKIFEIDFENSPEKIRPSNHSKGKWLIEIT